MNGMEKKLRRNEFFPHPELNMHDWKGLWGLVAKMHVPFYIFLLFYQDYFPSLATYDAVIVMAMVIFIFVVKPLMMHGVISGYYRKQYEGWKSMIWSFVIIGATIRTNLLVLYYVFVFSWISSDDTKYRYILYMNQVQETFSSIVGLGAGIILSGYLIFSLFYKRRFISIREFTFKVNENMKLGWDYKESSYRVLNETAPLPEFNVTSELLSNSNSRNCIERKNTKSAFSPMRRKARR